MRLSSFGDEGLEGAGPGARSDVRGEEPAADVAEGNGLRAESALVDQMELPKTGVVLDQGLLPRSDAVGAVGELELLGQECKESLVGTSQMEEDTGVKSGQVCS